jgi:hypothetical protein
MLWTIAITALATLLIVVVSLNFTGPEKQLERKIEHRYSVSDPQFRREMGVMLGPAIMPGNHVVDLENGDEIFPAMLAAIRGAQKTITFETYIYWEGKVGQSFANALSERARAGVRVKVTIDWVGSITMDERQLQQMEDAGVHVERYRPLHWYNLGRINNRTHRKLLVVDGKIGFTGGVGIGDPWQGNAQDPDHWRDLHFRIEGPAVSQFQAAFNDNWIKTTGEVLNGADYFPQLERAGAMDAHLFISSPSGGSESMHLMYLMAIAAAERSIDLQAAYFIPDELITKALIAPSWRAHPRRRAGEEHGFGCRALRFEGRLGTVAAGGRGDPRIRTDHVPQQDAGRGQGTGIGRLDQLRPALVPTQRRSQPQCLRPRFRPAHDGSLRKRPQADQALHLPDLEESAAEGKTFRNLHPAVEVAAVKRAGCSATRNHGIFPSS